MTVKSCFGWTALCLLAAASLASAAPPSFEERVKAQEAIERVYYAHRIWPAENPAPKPPFERMVPRAALEAKVRETLKKSAALEKFWQRPITAAQLQAEMDRMAAETKDPATLLELFAALDDDPTLIAECLARPALADRLLREAYAGDARLHRETRERAEAASASWGGVPAGGSPGVRRTFVATLAPDGGRAETQPNDAPGSVALGADEFARAAAESPEAGAPAVLRETPEAFVVVRARLKTRARLELETLTFAKRDLSEWLESLPADDVAAVAPQPESGLRRPTMAAAVCNSGTWTQATSLVGVPDSRRYFAAVWTGTEMIVWGGTTSTSPFVTNTGGRYNPATDTWTPTSTGTNCPTARELPAYVWTGTEMIVWGGNNAANVPLADGGRYNPVADSWAATSTGTGCPAARTHLTAVWTGNAMIVWGGVSSTAYENTGARYTPATDTWAPTSTGADCPAGRHFHTAVWTGTAMIVWGGSTMSGSATYYLGTGGRYNPTTDTWMPTATSPNCPAGRYQHSAVWTGAEMIVWGGSAGANSYLNSGGRYDPVHNAWTATSTGTNCPVARTWHTATWTGTEMIVWGGYLNVTPYYQNTGGRYNPTTDAWIPTSTGTNCPVGREYHSALWTGSKLIVWGGNGFFDTRTGGIYVPDGPVPDEVPANSLRWPAADSLSWSAASCAAGYRVYRGDAAVLASLPTGAPACPVYDGTATTTGSILSGAPGAGNAEWYLVAGYNAQGEGSLGRGASTARAIHDAASCP